MLRKSYLLSGILLLMIFASLVGCNSTSKTTQSAQQETTAKGDTQDAASYPEKPITLVVSSSPGGGGDVIYRTFAQIAEKYTDQPIIIDNRPGGAGAIAIGEVSKRPADGYTILGVGSSEAYTFAHGEIPYTMDDVKPIVSLTSFAYGIAVSEKNPYGMETYEDLMQQSKEGLIQILSAGMYNTNHVTALKFLHKQGIEGDYIAYESAGEASRSLAAGNGHMAVASAQAVYGRERVLAITGPERLEAMPEIPTLKELGVEGFEDHIMYRGLGVVPDTPQEIIDEFIKIVEQVYNDPEWKEFVNNVGEDVMFQTGDQLQQTFKSFHDEAKELFEVVK